MFGLRFDQPGFLLRLSFVSAALALLLLLLFLRPLPAPDPAIIAAGYDDEVALVAGGALHRLDSAGQSRGQRPLDMLGVESAVRGLSMGLDRLLLVETLEGRLHRCPRDISGCQLLGTGYRDVELAEEEGLIYALSESASTIQVMELNGRPLYELDLSGLIEAPVQMLWLGLGHLLLLDGADNQLVVIRDEGESRHTVVERRAPVAGQRLWVMRDHLGQTWTLRGGLERLNARGEVDLQIPWRLGPRPMSVALTSDALLLADPALGVWQIDLRNGGIAAFGDHILRESLDAVVAVPFHWRVGQGIGFLALLAAVLLGFRASWLLRRQQDEQYRRQLLAMSASINLATGEVSRHDHESAPTESPIVWLRPSRDFLLQVRLLGLLVMAAAAGYGIWLLETGLWQSPFLLVLLAMLALMAQLCIGAGAMRLGNDGQRLHVVDFLGRRASAPLRQVAFRGQRLQVGGLVVPLVGWRGWVFDPSRFEEVMAPILSRWRRHMRVTAALQPWQTHDLVTVGVLALAISSLLLRLV